MDLCCMSTIWRRSAKRTPGDEDGPASIETMSTGDMQNGVGITGIELS